jgi:hypothetical protein
MKTARTLVSLAAVAALGAGCYRTRFEMSPPQAEVPSTEYNDHFHFSVINVIEVSRPLDLQRACGGAPPTAIEEQVGILGAIVNAVLSYFIPIISVHNATIYCPMGGAMPGAYPQRQPYPAQDGQQPYPQGGQPYPPQGQPYPPQGQPQQYPLQQ